MKTIRKEFWVSDLYLETIKRNSGTLHGLPDEHAKNKITISYEVSDRKVEITERDFDLAIRFADRQYSSSDASSLKYIDILKDQLFKDK